MTPNDLSPTGDGAPTLDELHEELAGLQRALETRTLIGQATGILAASLRLRTDQGWELLRIASTVSNIRLRDVARVLVDSNDGRLRAGDGETAARVSAVLPEAVARVRRSTDPSPSPAELNFPVEGGRLDA